MRIDLHGLCALCLFGVINNQLWPYYIFHGSYGLDIIFIIIGYETHRQLILSRLSNKTPISNLSNLAFRYSSKLLPIYLVLCGFIVFACIFLMSPSEFPELIRRTHESIAFVSNFKFGYEEIEYFPATPSLYPFKHTWSVSLVFQFVIFIAFPLFLIFPDMKNRMFLSAVFILTCISFAFYWLLEIDQPENLFDRGWQFGVGFLALAFGHWKELWKNGDETLIADQFKSNKTHYRFSVFDERRPFYFKSTLLNLLLVVMLVAPIPFSSLFYRPLLTFVGVLIVVIGEREPCLLLDNRLFKPLNKVGFAGYLWFWPLLTLYKYCFGVHWYIPLQDGFVLLLLPYAIGYLIDLFMKRYLEMVECWWKVLVTLGLCYLFVFSMLACMSNYNVIPYRSPLTAKQQTEVRELITHLYKTQGYEQVFNERQAMRFNSLLFAYSYNQHYCTRVQERIFVDKFYYFDFVCVEKGSGTKTMMLIGDRNVRELLHGVRHHFSQIYSKLIVISSDACAPFLNEDFKLGEQKCLEFSKQVRQVVSKWSGDIDVLVFNYQYPEGYEIPFNDASTDKYFLALEDFYEFMSKHVKDRIFMPTVDLRFNIPPLIPFIQKRLFFHLDLSIFNLPIEDHKRRLLDVRKRIDAIKCEKCLRVEMSEIFCSPVDSKCYATDMRRKLSYFRDESRLNAFGSMFYAEHLHSLFNNQNYSSPLFKSFPVVREF